MMVVPLFHRHRILTQVAADNVNIIKLLPPLICGQEEIDYFVGALDDVLQGRAQWLRAPLRVRSHHGQGRASQDREGATQTPPTMPPSANGNGNGNGSPHHGRRRSGPTAVHRNVIRER